MLFLLGIVVGMALSFIAFLVYILMRKPQKKIGTLWVDRSTSIYDIYFEVNDYELLSKNGTGRISIRGTTSHNKQAL